MKALGLTVAGTSAVAATIPVFNSFDDMLSSGEQLEKGAKRAWYVKTLDPGKATIDIDWDMVKVLNNRHDKTLFNSATQSAVYTPEVANQFSATNTANNDRAIQAKHGGYRIKDYALSASLPSQTTIAWALANNNPAATNIGKGMAPYDASDPVYNSKIVRAAATFLGASGVYFGVLTPEEMNIANTCNTNGEPYIIDQDADWAYSEGSGNSAKYYVPNKKQLYAIGIILANSKELWRHGSTENEGAGQLRGAVNSYRYQFWSRLYTSLQTFFRYLGFTAFGYPATTARSWLPSNGDAVLTGACETSRQYNFSISPEFGPTNGVFSVITNMPLAPTGGVDAGIFRFCKSCAKCAITCPTGAIPDSKVKDDWESHFVPSNYKYNKGNQPVTWTYPGKKNIFWDATACRIAMNTASCSNCIGTCTFNVNSGAGIHDMVKGMLATTPIFNGFFAKADEFYGFENIDGDKKEEWWDKRLPVFGIDSTRVSADGAYRKLGY